MGALSLRVECFSGILTNMDLCGEIFLPFGKQTLELSLETCQYLEILGYQYCAQVFLLSSICDLGPLNRRWIFDTNSCFYYISPPHPTPPPPLTYHYFFTWATSSFGCHFLPTLSLFRKPNWHGMAGRRLHSLGMSAALGKSLK